MLVDTIPFFTKIKTVEKYAICNGLLALYGNSICNWHKPVTFTTPSMHIPKDELQFAHDRAHDHIAYR